MPEGQELVVVTPWYPSPDAPYDGVFVRESLVALAHPSELTTVVHLRNVPPDHPADVVRKRTDLGALVRIDVPVDTTLPRLVVAETQRAALRAAALPELAAADVVHAHVGMPSGWAVSGLLAPDQRLVTTEHATYLTSILRLPEGHRAYGDLLRRADLHLAVTEREARKLRAFYPELRDRIRVIGNPVDPRRFTLRDRPVTDLDRWVYVGNFVDRKGVADVLRSFALWCEDHAAAGTSLTLVGGGPLEEDLRALATELGVADRVCFHGPADPDALPGLFAEADVLVHLSEYETFGLTVVEAAMSGLPVVATACVGPEETLSDATSQGLAELVGVPPRPEQVAQAMARLTTRLATCDTAAVREVLVERYGSEVYGTRLRRALDGEPLDPAPDPAAPVVLCLGTSARAAGRLVRVQSEVLRTGGRAALVTTQPGDAVAADPRTEVLDLWPRESRMPWHLAERLFVARGPEVLIRLARKTASLAASAPGPQREVARRAVNLLSKVLSVQQRLAWRVHRVLDRLFYSHFDAPRIAGHVLRRHSRWVKDLDPAVVVMGDQSALPLAWRLARLLPGAEVEGAVSDAVVRQLVRDRLPSPRVETQG